MCPTPPGTFRLMPADRRQFPEFVGRLSVPALPVDHEKPPLFAAVVTALSSALTLRMNGIE
jgi:hypothetical protein